MPPPERPSDAAEPPAPNRPPELALALLLVAPSQRLAVGQSQRRYPGGQPSVAPTHPCDAAVSLRSPALEQPGPSAQQPGSSVQQLVVRQQPELELWQPVLRLGPKPVNRHELPTAAAIQPSDAVKRSDLESDPRQQDVPLYQRLPNEAPQL